MHYAAWCRVVALCLWWLMKVEYNSDSSEASRRVPWFKSDTLKRCQIWVGVKLVWTNILSVYPIALPSGRQQTQTFKLTGYDMITCSTWPLMVAWRILKQPCLILFAPINSVLLARNIPTKRLCRACLSDVFVWRAVVVIAVDVCQTRSP